MSGFARAAAELSRALIHGIAWFVLVATLAPAGSAMAAFIGGALGCLSGAKLARTTLRTPAILLAATVLLCLVVWLDSAFTQGSALAGAVGPVSALRIATTFAALLTAAIVSGALRACSKRRSIFGVFELLLVAVAFTQLFIPHRHGAINRPFYLADWIIALGWDPTWLFLFVGGTATALGLVLLLREPRFGRAIVNLGIIGALLALIVIATPMLGMPPPPEGGAGLGLRPENSDAREGDGTAQTPRGGSTNGALEFRNKYDTGGDRVPVAVVLFHDDYSPPSGVYYFRQGAFSQYNGRKLVVSGRRDVDRDLIPFFPARPIQIEDAPEMNENRGPLETTIALMADHMQPFALEAPVEVAPMQNPSPNRFRRIYKATSGVLTADYTAMLDAPLGSTSWSKELWAHYTETPPRRSLPGVVDRHHRGASRRSSTQSNRSGVRRHRLARQARYLQPEERARRRGRPDGELSLRRPHWLLRPFRACRRLLDAQSWPSRARGHRLRGQRGGATRWIVAAPLGCGLSCVAGGIRRRVRMGRAGCISGASA